MATCATERLARRWGLLAAVALHAAALVLFSRLEPVRAPVAPPEPVLLRLVEAPEPPRPVIEPPTPRPVVKRPVPRTKPPVRPPDPVPATQPPTSDVAPLEPLVASEAPTAAPVREVPPASSSAPPPAPEATKPVVVPVTEPRYDAAYLDNPPPRYPAVSRRFGEQGRVLLRVQVDPQGQPTRVALHASSGHDRLDAAALETVRRWRFVPARRGEEPISAWVLVPISFNLRS